MHDTRFDMRRACNGPRWGGRRYGVADDGRRGVRGHVSHHLLWGQFAKRPTLLAFQHGLRLSVSARKNLFDRPRAGQAGSRQFRNGNWDVGFDRFRQTGEDRRPPRF